MYQYFLAISLFNHAVISLNDYISFHFRILFLIINRNTFNFYNILKNAINIFCNCVYIKLCDLKFILREGYLKLTLNSKIIPKYCFLIIRHSCTFLINCILFRGIELN
jgi:hypothetical protein